MGEMDRVLYSMYNTFGKSFRNVQEKVLKVQYSHKSALLSPLAGCMFSCQKPDTCPSTCTIYTYPTRYLHNIITISTKYTSTLVPPGVLSTVSTHYISTLSPVGSRVLVPESHHVSQLVNHNPELVAVLPDRYGLK